MICLPCFISEISTKDNCAKPKTPEKPKTLSGTVRRQYLRLSKDDGMTKCRIGWPRLVWTARKVPTQPGRTGDILWTCTEASRLIWCGFFCCFKMMKILLVSVKANRNILLIWGNSLSIKLVALFFFGFIRDDILIGSTKILQNYTSDRWD